jgi:hypothetical protein
VRKRAEAATGERLEVNQQAERFEVIEEPRPPERPEAPNRPFIAGAGAIVSLGFGFAIALLLELLNPAIRNAGMLERRFDMRPMMVMPRIVSQREKFRRKWLIRLGVFAVIVVIPMGLWYVDQYMRPLSVIADQVMNRTGIGDMIDLVQRRFSGSPGQTE